jgi:phage terminase large subunit-like protein
VRWIEDNCICGEGDWYGQLIVLRPDQKRFLYRWYEYCGGCGFWHFDEGLRGEATGGGKTQFIAAVVVLEFAGPKQLAMPSPNIPIAAASFEQANLLFSAVATMCGGRDQIAKESPLCGFFEVYDTEVKFADGRPGRIFRVAAVAGTNEGGLPTLFVCDELHEWGEPGSNKARVKTVIGKSTRKRRTLRGSGRIISLSTAGFDIDHSLLGALVKLGREVVKNWRRGPRFLFDWREAPDGLDYSKKADRETAVRAGSAAAGILWSVSDRVNDWGKPEWPAHEWLRYYANKWVDVAEDSWLKDHPQAWSKCQSDRDIPDQAEVVVAVDMALKRDSVSVKVGFRTEDQKAIVRDRVFVADEGGRIDHLEVIDYIRKDLAKKHQIVEITYDPRFFEVPARLLEDEGFNMVEFPQSPERMTPACGHALEMILAGRVLHDGDPTMARHVKSAAKRPGERGFTLSKGKSRSHIDSAITLVIVLWRLFAPEPEEDPPVKPFVMWSR